MTPRIALLFLALVGASAAQSAPPAALELQLTDPGVNVPLPCGLYGLDCPAPAPPHEEPHPKRARFSRGLKTAAGVLLGVIVFVAYLVAQGAGN